MPGELPFGQLSAACIAILLAVVAVVGVLRGGPRVRYLLVVLLLAVPLAGFVAYALVPGPPPRFGTYLNLAVLPLLAALAAGVVMVGTGVRRRRPLGRSTLLVLSAAMAVLWFGLVLALSAVLADWQPAYAVVEIALNVAWLILWLPRSVRTFRGANSVEIAAPRERVFALVADPTNRPRYEPDVVSVGVDPPGPLASGSKVTVVQRYESGVRGPRMLPSTVEIETMVEAMVPGESVVTTTADGMAKSSIELVDTPAGTSVTIHGEAVVPYRAAVLGTVLLLRSQRSKRRAEARLSLARLKELLEHP